MECKTDFIVGTNSYMHQHQNPVFWEFIKNRGLLVQHVLNVLVTLTYIMKIKSLKILQF